MCYKNYTTFLIVLSFICSTLHHNMSSLRRSNFQRGQSKVWFTSYPERDEYGFVAMAPTPVLPSLPKANKSLSPPEITTTSWSYRRGSPGSFKSHDSGFSDSDNPSPPANNSSLESSSSASDGTTTPKRSPLSRYSSGSSSGPATPPTVIRKKIDINVLPGLCRRISFSAPSSPIYERIETPSLISQIDSFNYATTSPAASKGDFSLDSSMEEDYSSPKKGSRLIKRSKVIRRSSNQTEAKLLRCVSQISIGSANDFYHQAASSTEDEPRVPSITTDAEEPPMMQTAIPQTPTQKDTSIRSYHNETLVFGTGLTENLERTHHTLPTYDELFPNQTSTPKATPKNLTQFADSVIELRPTHNWDDFTYYEYSNPLLNGHSPSIQHWLDDTRRTYCHEVLATLQVKSIAQVATQNGNITTTAAGKIIRSLQTRCGQLQYEFEYLEKLLEDTDDDDALIKEVPERVLRLHTRTLECMSKISTERIFDVTSGQVGIQFQNNVAYISNLSYDLIRTTSTRDLSRLQPLGILEDVLLLKRYVLMTMRMVFERLVQLIVDRIADVNYDFILRSNLSLLAMLSNVEFTGLASLTDAFMASSVVRILLTICVESMLPDVRTLSLRVLTTICATNEAISEFEVCGGSDIIVAILCDRMERTDQEVREALSVFTQVTADWHGPGHNLRGLKPLVETLVTRLTELATSTSCCQTLLLSVAALKNLARIESSAIYSLMSNESVLRLKSACDARGPNASVFLIVSLRNRFLFDSHYLTRFPLCIPTGTIGQHSGSHVRQSSMPTSSHQQIHSRLHDPFV